MVQYLLLATILLLPFQFALNVGKNIDLVTTRILIPVIFLLWAFRGMARKKIWLANRAETWLLASFFSLSVASLFFGLDWEKGARKFLYLLTLLPFYFVASDILRKKKLRIEVLRAVWISGTLAALVGIFQFILPFIVGLNSSLKLWKSLSVFFLGSAFSKLVIANPSWLVNIAGQTHMRAFGFFPDPHMFSFFVALCMFSGLGYFFWEKKAIWRILSGTATALMFFSLILSFSRGAYLGVAAGGLFFLFFQLKRSRNLGRALAVIAVFSLLALVFFQGPIKSRLASTFDFREGSNLERIKNWQQALETVKDYPVFGVGLGNYSSHIDPMSTERSSIYAHNLLLDISAETGIINGAIFLALLLASIWKSLASKNVLGLGIASGLVYFFIHGIFDTPLWSPQVFVALLVILALGVNINNLKNGKTAKTD